MIEAIQQCGADRPHRFYDEIEDNNPPPIIETRDVSITYGGRCAIRNVSLKIPKGKITALIGPSGCGKSSMLLAFNKLIELSPGSRVSGEITVDGQSILTNNTNVRALRRRMGMVFQKPNPFPFSIGRNFDLVMDEAGIFGRKERLTKLECCLDAVGLSCELHGRLDRPALELSGGQQQRLCIARSLVLSPDIMLLDEPCSALDPVSTARIEELLLSMRERMSIVIVTHNLRQARRIGDHCALFWTADGAGYVLESRKATDLFSSPKHEITKAYIQGALS